jgi:hypothetical protein
VRMMMRVMMIDHDGHVGVLTRVACECVLV